MVKGWEEVKLGDIAEIRMCKRIFAEQTTPNGDIPFFKIGTFGKDPDAHISRSLYEEYRDKYSFPNKGDILLSAAGTLGRTVIYDGRPAYFQDSNIVWLEIDHNRICNDYLFHCYQVMEWASPEGSTISRLYNSIIRDTSINLPPLLEQRRIAAVLSDTDKLIVALEKLIAKKRAIKQGTMQDLLTGKRRLPGFSDEWVKKTLDTIMKIRKEKVLPYVCMDLRCIELEHIEPLTGRLLGCVDAKKQRSLKAVFQSGDVLFGKLRPYLKKYCIPIFDGVCSTEFRVFTAYDDTIVNVYIFHLVQTPLFLNIANSAAGTKMPRADWSLMKDIEFVLPYDITEQTAIASILSDMDTEIDVLTAKLNKIKHIKQAMMSELLTGRIRLIEQKTTSKAKIVEFPKAKKSIKGHNQAIEDAVILGVVTDLFAAEQYPLAPFYSQKLPYLLHRHIEGIAEGYKKLAAGPYNPTYKYRTALPIALKKQYVIGQKATYNGHNYLNLLSGSKIDEAKKYFAQWFGDEPLKWLEQFKIKNRRDELELLTTVDMAMLELSGSGKSVNVSTVKKIIQESEEWKAKLKRDLFSDENIARAIKWSNGLFGLEGKNHG